MGYPTTSTRVPGNARATAERTEKLLGERGEAANVAITRADAATQGAVKLASGYVSTTPTAAQHNALVDDIKALAAILNRLGATISGL